MSRPSSTVCTKVPIQQFSVNAPQAGGEYPMMTCQNWNAGVAELLPAPIMALAFMKGLRSSIISRTRTLHKIPRTSPRIFSNLLLGLQSLLSSNFLQGRHCKAFSRLNQTAKECCQIKVNDEESLGPEQNGKGSRDRWNTILQNPSASFEAFGISSQNVHRRRRSLANP